MVGPSSMTEVPPMPMWISVLGWQIGRAVGLCTVPRNAMSAMSNRKLYSADPKVPDATSVIGTVGSSSPPSPPQPSPPPTVDEILASAPQSDGDAQSVSCLRSGAYTEVEVINPELLLFRGRGERMWLNRMRQACVGLRLDDALAFEMRNSRLCELDTIRGIDSFGGYWSATSAGCSLGSFDPVSPEQADLLKTELSNS